MFNSVIGWTRISRIQGVIGRNSVNMGTVYAETEVDTSLPPGAYKDPYKQEGQGSNRKKRPYGPYFGRLGIKMGIEW